MTGLWLVAVALADPAEVEVGGHLKSFALATFPYASALMPEDSYGQGIVNGRVKLGVEQGRIRFEVHHAVTSTLGASAASGFSAGVGQGAPQMVDLGWEGLSDPALKLVGRTDRLAVRLSGEGVEATLGRQPISFGHGMFFTPLDLVNPFFPTAIDQEYKPGIDALRLDLFHGTSAKATMVVSYAGDWDLQGMNAVAYGQTTVGVTDLGLFAAAIRGDPVLGGTLWSAIGPVGVHGDVSLTLPDGEEDPFVRAVLGADGRPGPTTTVAAEVYVQTLGERDPNRYLLQMAGPRYGAGELWLAGKLYGALSLSQEITPLVTVSSALIGNLTDPSLLWVPGASWSVAENAELTAGAYVGLGQRPNGADSLPEMTPLTTPESVLTSFGVRSEFGLMPSGAYLQTRLYF